MRAKIMVKYSMSRIKKNGLLTGDDYYEPNKFSFTYGYGVIKAVDEFVKKNALEVNFYTKGTQYIIQKNWNERLEKI